MFLGYNTNGLAHHDLFDAVELLAEIGFLGVAITIDHGALSPPCATAGLSSSAFRSSPALLDKPAVAHSQIERLRELLEKYQMRSVVETGARFLLDPRVKHEPTLLSEARRRRIDFYKYAIDRAAELGSDCVSLWSGVLREPISREQAMDRLVAGLREVLDYAAAHKVIVAFEPEPGMLIDTTRAFEELLERIDSPNLRLTLDVGHLHCQGETPIPDVIRRWAPRLANVHVEDMRRGRHEHLMFGEGEIDFPPILRTLEEVGYTGGVYVELSRHSHEGPTAALRAFEFLQTRNDECRNQNVEGMTKFNE
ncbi:MAG: sugar phosphate isomerase/epimerase [Planctomycetes bacterium]|nr:sugar phosphate isomerase/epimerase [Planctomycetota bacterium]MBU4399366.1 sugar phosphate isomerase/epimerase [Planctomycetota bacterium]MCG2685625.1 sugar phosphate isomerase/epimerase [Planctomycetales bacterium]